MEYQLKNQQRVIIRKAEPEDAKEMVSVMKTAFDETRFLSRNADEFQTTPEQERVFIENVTADPNQELYVAVYEDQVIGICSVVFLILFTDANYNAPASEYLLII